MEKPRRFAMMRDFHLADWFTMGNAFSGMITIFLSMAYLQEQDVRFLYFAAAFTPLALIFDIFDGRIARWRQQSSAMGRELDSLADVISFGVAPATFAYACGMQGLWDMAVLVAFVGCGVSRQARYNITAESMSDTAGKVKYFEGTPIPTSTILVAVMVIAIVMGDIGEQLWFGTYQIGPARFHPLVLMYALSGSLMISTVKIPKL